MASSRYDGDNRDQRAARTSYDQHRQGRSGQGGERGFFERAGDEISSWFGDDEAERRREMDERSSGGRSPERPYGHAQQGDDGRRDYGEQAPRYRDDNSRRPYTGRMSARDARDHYSPDMDRDQSSRDQGGYRPMTGDYGRSAEGARDLHRERDFRERDPRDRDPGDQHRDRGQSGGRSFFERAAEAVGMGGAAAAGATTAHDRHYSEWRQRQIDQIDQDYDEYRREHQSKFESDFSNWRSTRQSKRQLLQSIQPHMQVVGSDDQPLGTVDKVRGDRLILTKDDSADGHHHSINGSMVDRVEGDRVILDKKADEAKAMFGNEERDRALYERDGQREPGAHVLDRSFSGTY